MKVKTKKARKIFAVAFLALLLVSVLSFSVGADNVSFGEVPFEIMTENQWISEYSSSIYYPTEFPVNGNFYTAAINISELDADPSEFNGVSFLQRTVNGQRIIFLYYSEDSGDWFLRYDETTQYITSGDILLIPFYAFNSAPWYLVFSQDVIRILNNEQLTSIHNDLPDIIDESFDDGYSQGSTAGYNGGYAVGYEYGWNLGYDSGLSTGRAENEVGNAGKQLIFAVVEAPFNVLRQMLSFDILGVNVFGLVMSVFTLCLIAAVIRFII